MSVGNKRQPAHLQKRSFDQLGRGDVRLVAGDTVVVLETKFLYFAASGRTARVRRTQHRKKLVEQCVVYCAWTRLQTAFAGKRVVGFVATNERGDGALRMVVASMSLAEAVRHVLEKAGQPHVWNRVVDRLKALLPLSKEWF
jgi:hypothetical protein